MRSVPIPTRMWAPGAQCPQLHVPRSVAEAQVDLRPVGHDGAGHVAAWERPGQFAGAARTAVALSR